MFAGTFAPLDWAFCNGQIIAINENQALFTLIGTTYGGDGVNTFALPNLQSRIPVHQGAGFVMAQVAGQENVTLTAQQIPAHNHPAKASSATGNQASPTGHIWAQSSLNQYSNAAPSVTMSTAAVGNSPGALPHDNMMPYLVVNFIIALFGIYPSQN
jgi:microcystin-dependent protein